MYSSIVVFLEVFVETILFEAHSHGLLNFSKKALPIDMLEKPFIFNGFLLFSKRKFSDKRSVLE